MCRLSGSTAPAAPRIWEEGRASDPTAPAPVAVGGVKSGGVVYEPVGFVTLRWGDVRR